MKKKWILLLLCAVLLMSALASPAFADDVCFIAINDNLLELSNMPAFVGTTAYVPGRIFSSFNIYYTFFPSDNTAMIYTEAKQFYFELSSGNTYDSSGNYYSTQAIMRNGQVYMPAKFICSQFGLTYSLISGTGHGDLLRITNGSAILSDDRFLSAASILMDSYYNTYMGNISPSDKPPVPDNQPEEEPDRHDTEVLLSFTGLPSDKLLDTLDSHKTPACFFLSAEDVRSSPDTVRRLAASGHSVGVLCGDEPAADYAEASALMFDAARFLPFLVAAADAEADACREMAAQNGLAFLDYDIDAAQESGSVGLALVTSQIEFSTELASVRFRCDENTEEMLPNVLRYLMLNHFSVRAARETDAVQ